MELCNGFVLNNGKVPYTIEAQLGSGGFGITYKASAIIDSGNGPEKKFFAIKEHFIKEWCERDNNTGVIITSTPLKQRVEDGKRDFLAEAQRLAQINHPNIIRVYELFEENDTAYYVMEYIEGENLNDFVSKNGAMSINSMIAFFAPICNAVEALHVYKMTHLDIKPANIMLKTSGNHIEPVLIDFGLSKHYDENGNATSTIRLQGCSDGYAPIEQYAGIDKFSPQSDVYSLAATILFCISGQNPPKANELNTNTLLQQIPYGTPQNIINAITHAMNPNKEMRTPSINHFVYELNNNVVSAPTPTPTPSNTVISNPQHTIYNSNSTNNNNSGNKLVWILVPIIAILVGVAAWLWISKNDSNSSSDDPENSTFVDSSQKSKKEKEAEERAIKAEQEAKEAKEKAAIAEQEKQLAEENARKAEQERQKQQEKKEKAQNRLRYGNCTLKGTIAGKSFTITLNNGFNGYSCYNPKYGTMPIDGYISGTQLTLNEYSNGNYVGTYEGTFDGNYYKGSYYRSKDGKVMSFSMRAQ